MFWTFLLLLFTDYEFMHRQEADRLPVEPNDHQSDRLSFEQPPMTFKKLTLQANKLSREAYDPPEIAPSQFSDLNYEEYQNIQFRHETAVWGEDSPFALEMYHPGFVQKNQVNINLVDKNSTNELVFSSDYFHYGELGRPKQDNPNLKFAGFRVVGSFPGRDDRQELMSFLGSSYFRCCSPNTMYGASNRGLAVNVGLPCDEEFPVFREFWILKPQQGDQSLSILALLDSEHMTGAYRFILTPRKTTTTVDVISRIFPRERPEKIAVAPITSMWMWGDGISPPPLERRPHVHDSDGLLVCDEHRWIWRPLTRLAYPSVSQLEHQNLRGYGLLQRNTDPDQYCDSFAMYHKRPSIWIQPRNNWPQGKLELLELPGAHEGIDNIGAYWSISEIPEPGEEIAVDYRIHYFSGDLECFERELLAKCVDSQVRNDPSGTTTIEIKFQGETLKNMIPGKTITPTVSTVRAELIHSEIQALEKDCWLLQLELRPTSQEPFEVHAGLDDAGRKLTEFYSTILPVKPPPYQYPQVYTRKE